MKQAKNKRQRNKTLSKKTGTPKKVGSPFEIVIGAIQQLPNERMQTVLLKRFGLNDANPKTLEVIGKGLGVTRERIRQIESEALRKIAKHKYSADLKKLIKRLYNLLLEYNGVASEFRIINEFSDKKLKESDSRALAMVLKMDNNFYFFNKPQEYEKTWYLKGADIGIIPKLKTWLVNGLSKEKKSLAQQEIIDILNSNPEFNKLADDVLYSYIDIPKVIQQDIFGKWGMYNWPGIKPRGVRDKIYLVFEKIDKPVHFSKIAKEANRLKIDKKIARTPTIHNELIKDPRFILIGRGIYALKRWKYQSGTVADILVKVLEKSNKALTKDILVTEVLKQRQVKPATVILNLQRSNLFVKEAGDLYSLKSQNDKQS
ncbi:MAG: sigma factor-like helix-turn-helix DNA-binding protein [Patescibacteria group bacterium]|nr:sigma factor-like helix-turn-helix DNA-binding protein [Patescibacteria group bacterium]